MAVDRAEAGGAVEAGVEGEGETGAEVGHVTAGDRDLTPGEAAYVVLSLLPHLLFKLRSSLTFFVNLCPFMSELGAVFDINISAK